MMYLRTISPDTGACQALVSKQRTYLVPQSVTQQPHLKHGDDKPDEENVGGEIEDLRRD